MNTSCEVSPGFLKRCRRPAPTVCQYCGRSFCEEHGRRLDDGQEICSSTRCEQKRIDVEAHFVYQEEVAARNEGRSCGQPRCDDPLEGQCGKCQGIFCGYHLRPRVVEEHRAHGSAPVRVSVCPHCDKRRALWSRR